jgi:hypothetical protein
VKVALFYQRGAMILMPYFAVVRLLEHGSHGKISSSVYFVSKELGVLTGANL